MATPFGSYRGGYQVLPEGWMQTMTQVGKNYAEGMQNLGNSLVSAASTYAGGVKERNLGQQQAPVNMSQYQQIAKLTGIEVNPELLNRFNNLGQMSGPEISQFNKSLQDATNQALLIDELRRKQQAFQMQQSAAQQAMQRSMQSQALQDRRESALRAIGSVPLGASQMSMPAPQQQTAVPGSMININPSTLMPYGGMTINQPVRF